MFKKDITKKINNHSLKNTIKYNGIYKRNKRKPQWQTKRIR